MVNVVPVPDKGSKKIITESAELALAPDQVTVKLLVFEATVDDVGFEIVNEDGLVTLIVKAGVLPAPATLHACVDPFQFKSNDVGGFNGSVEAKEL